MRNSRPPTMTTDALKVRRLTPVEVVAYRQIMLHGGLADGRIVGVAPAIRSVELSGLSPGGNGRPCC